MTIIPTILRKEIRLFETTHDYEIKLKLIKSLSYYKKILYLIFDYPHKHYTFKYFEV